MNISHADLILTAGNITTMVDDTSSAPAQAEALAIVGDRIAAVGSVQDMAPWSGPDTRTIDLGGRRVVPGLIDAHVHFARAGFTWNSEVRWGTVRSLHDGLELIAQRAGELAPGSWIMVIGGWHPAQFSEGRHPTVEDLDRVAPDHPVLVQYLYEYGLLNSTARPLVPWDDASGAGVDAATIDTDDEGRPSGVVRTLPSLKWLYSQLPVPDLQDQVRSTIAAGQEFARFGVTGVIDGGGANTGPDVYRPIFQTWRQGDLIPRVRLVMHSAGAGEEETDIGGYTRFLHPHHGDEWLSVLAVGEIVMWPLHDDFDRPPDLSEANKERLEAIFRTCASQGWTVQMHLIHPETTDFVVGLWSRIHSDTSLSDLRWSIIHGQSVTAEHAELLAQMNAGVICEALLRMGGDHAVDTWGPERLAHAPDIRRLKASGVHVAAGSDGLRAATYNPFATLQWLTTGTSLSGKQIWDPGNVLSRFEALALLTRDAAWFSFEEESRGRLQPGYLADVAVLTEDYFDVTAQDLPDIRSALTVIGGRVVWDAVTPAP